MSPETGARPQLISESTDCQRACAQSRLWSAKTPPPYDSDGVSGNFAGPSARAAGDAYGTRQSSSNRAAPTDDLPSRNQLIEQPGDRAVVQLSESFDVHVSTAQSRRLDRSAKLGRVKPAP